MIKESFIIVDIWPPGFSWLNIYVFYFFLGRSGGMRKYAMTSCLNRVRQVLEKDSVSFCCFFALVVVMVNNQSRVGYNEWDLSVLLKIRDPQLWWFFTLGLREFIFCFFCLQVPTNFSRPIRTRRLQRLELSSSRLMNEAWRRFHRCRCRLCCSAPWPDIWIILPFASNVMERYAYEFSLVSQLFVIKKELCRWKITFPFFPV